MLQVEFAGIESRVLRFGAGDAQTMESQAADATATSSKTQTEERVNPCTPIKSHGHGTDSSDEVDEDDDDGPALPNQRGRKRKSILQPKGSKFSRKAAGRCNSLRAARSQDDETMEDVSPIAIATTVAATQNHNKHQPRSDAAISEVPYHEYLPNPYIEVKLVHYDLPTNLPQGPGDLWSCEFEGCTKRVYEGSTKEGKQKIKEHFQEHEASAKEKIDLVMNERRPYLPVE